MEKVALKAPKLYEIPSIGNRKFKLSLLFSRKGMKFQRNGWGSGRAKRKKKEKTGEYKRKDKSEKDTEIFRG